MKQPTQDSLATYLGCSEEDTLLDLEVTPNRPDYNSFIGIAREIAALTGNSLRWPEINLEETAAEAESQATSALKIRRNARYQARLIRGVQVGPSPSWPQAIPRSMRDPKHQQCGRCHHLVMMEIGQPLHARLPFDSKQGRNRADPSCSHRSARRNIHHARCQRTCPG